MILDVTGRPLETPEAHAKRLAEEQRAERVLLLEAVGLLLGHHPQTLQPPANDVGLDQIEYRRQLAQAIVAILPPDALLRRWRIKVQRAVES